MSLGATAPRLTMEGTSATAGRPGVSGVQNSNDTSGPVHYLAKTRGTANGSNTIVQNDDYLGQLNWNGADGTQMVQAGNISMRVDGTPGVNDMPGRLVFMTTSDGANSPTERMRISENGDVDIGQTGGGVKLAVAGAVGPQNGSASAPTHTFYSDTDTGMYRYGVDTLRFTTGGTDAMQISSTQNTTLFGDLFLSKDSSSSNFMEIRFNDQDTTVGSGQKLGTVTAYSNDSQRDGIVGEVAFVYHDSSQDCNIEFKTYQNSTDTYTTRWKINYAGALVNTDSSAPANIGMASGTGIAFQDAGGSGTSTSNVLDSYEEGSWVVNMYDAVSGGNASSTQVTGRYTKIGQQVIASFDAFNNVSTSGLTAGNPVYFTLPFAASSTGRACGTVQLHGVTFTDSTTMVTTSVSDSQSRAALNVSGNGRADGTIKVQDFNGSTDDVVNWTLCYRADS